MTRKGRSENTAYTQETPSAAQQARALPLSPGVYLMKDRRGGILYIGKAINLRHRVRSYFSSTHTDRRHIPAMLERVHTIDWIATGTETGALLLEAHLIRKHQPPFNIELRDDKRYPWIRITIREPFPRLLVARRVTDPRSRYFGPYTDARAMRHLMDLTRRLFGLRSCNRTLPLSRPMRPCINYEMKRCSGACAHRISQEEYRKRVESAIRFLCGRRRALLRELRTAMEAASRAAAFEEAATLRDQMARIESASRAQQVDLSVAHPDCDVFGIHEGERSITMAVLGFREEVLLFQRRFVFDRIRWEGCREDRDALVVQYYQLTASDLPAVLLLPASLGASADMLCQGFNEQFATPVRVLVPRAGSKRHLVEMAEKNARLHAGSTAGHDPHRDLEELQHACGLDRLPLHIEAFDISNLGHSFAVAAMVHFTNGMPDARRFRRYRIKSVEGVDDFAMMMEVVSRRLTRLEREQDPFPDLLLIDGGKGQLSAANTVLARFENPPQLLSLSKKEELLWSPGSPDPVALPPAHPARRLVERIRNEVHHQAVTYHRMLRGKQFKRSALESIPGIGPRIAATLLRRFGSLEKVAALDSAQLTTVAGISHQKARVLQQWLQEKKTTP